MPSPSSETAAAAQASVMAVLDRASVPSTQLPLVSLFAAFVIAALFLTLRRKNPRRIRFRVVMRALFPRSLFKSPSCKADMWMFVLSSLLGSALLGGMLVSASLISSWTQRGLTTLFGPSAAPDLPAAVPVLAATVALYLAYEFAYWLDHYLKHRFAFLWAFHAVHHSAERLTPLTNYRVHPVDTILFFNIVALITGATQGVVVFLLGPGLEWTVGGLNVLLLVAMFLVVHLQHSELWIAFPGLWGRIFLSPAHHQVHHSVQEKHHNRNFGASLGVFDWLFGTLWVPGAKREVRAFGLGPQDKSPHSVTATMVMPLVQAGAVVAKAVRLPKPRPGGTLAPTWRPFARSTNSGA